MKRNNITQYIQSLNLPVIRLFVVFCVLSSLISCETEDDIPPPSAYVEPEPVDPGEGCTNEIIVPTLAEGVINFECGAPETTFLEKPQAL